VAAVRERVRGGGVCVFAIDTELLGHWWYEGVHWLEAVLDEADRQRLPLTTLDAASECEHHQPVPAPTGLGVSSWGEGGDLRTWSGPKVAAFAWRARAAELALARRPTPTDRALRELLALQSSDWAFLADRELAGDYPEERAQLHAEALARELRDPGAYGSEVRGLAPWLAGWV
jgi:1,4-alpha-glucan branching enzyme